MVRCQQYKTVVYTNYYLVPHFFHHATRESSTLFSPNHYAWAHKTHTDFGVYPVSVDSVLFSFHLLIVFDCSLFWLRDHSVGHLRVCAMENKRAVLVQIGAWGSCRSLLDSRMPYFLFAVLLWLMDLWDVVLYLSRWKASLWRSFDAGKRLATSICSDVHNVCLTRPNTTPSRCVQPLRGDPC